MKKDMLIQKMNAVFKRQQKNPATQYKYSYWIVQYANFLQSAQLNGATSDKEKVHTFLLQADMKAAATKKHAISALRWLYKYILEKDTPIPYRYIRPARKFPEFLTPPEVWSEMQKLSGTASAYGDAVLRFRAVPGRSHEPQRTEHLPA